MNPTNPETHSDIFYFLATTYLDKIGPTRLRRWINFFGNIKNLFSASAADLQVAGLKQQDIFALKNFDASAVERDLIWCEQNDCHLISIDDDRYPVLLREVASAPLLLFVRGQVELLSQSQIAMVGSRNPTASGRENADEFSRCLAQSGLIITSGMALGIDAASHRGALAVNGKTIAVTGSGFKHIYPASHRKLADDIMANGALITEFSPNTGPSAQNFPLRNRVISGMSLGVLVVEAAVRSGSLITAKFALEQNREVFAIPGSIHNSLARGCHELIRQGATLVEKAEDILEHIGALHALVIENKEKKPKLNKASRELLNHIGFEKTQLDTILIRSGKSANEIAPLLLMLELDGLVVVEGGGYTRI